MYPRFATLPLILPPCGIFLTISAAWHVIQFTRHGIESRWAIFQRSFLALTLLALAAFCLYFRIAGTSLAF